MKDTENVKEKISGIYRSAEKESNREIKQNKISRRDFLKKSVLGLGGLAALVSPISAFDIRDDNLRVFTSNDDGSTLTQALDIDQNADVQILNGNLTVEGTITENGSI